MSHPVTFQSDVTYAYSA